MCLFVPGHFSRSIRATAMFLGSFDQEFSPDDAHHLFFEKFLDPIDLFFEKKRVLELYESIYRQIWGHLTQNLIAVMPVMLFLH